MAIHAILLHLIVSACRMILVAIPKDSISFLLSARIFSTAHADYSFTDERKREPANGTDQIMNGSQDMSSRLSKSQ